MANYRPVKWCSYESTKKTFATNYWILYMINRMRISFGQREWKKNVCERERESRRERGRVGERETGYEVKEKHNESHCAKEKKKLFKSSEEHRRWTVKNMQCIFLQEKVPSKRLRNLYISLLCHKMYPFKSNMNDQNEEREKKRATNALTRRRKKNFIQRNAYEKKTLLAITENLQFA